MPEGVEVCITAQYLNRKLRHKVLKKVRVLSGKYVRKGVPGVELPEHGEYTVRSVDSKGKLMWIDLGGLTVISTYGMSGRWNFTKHPQHARVEFVFVDRSGKEWSLYFIDQRNFGNLCLTLDPELVERRKAELGPDLLKQPFTEDEFYSRMEAKLEKLSGRRKKLVKLLMDQTVSGIGSGIGNYLVAEIMFEARLSPHRTVAELVEDREACDRLSKAIKTIIKLSYASNNTGYMVHFKEYRKRHMEMIKKGELPAFHDDIDLGDRVFTFQVYQRTEDPFGNPVTRETIIDRRTTHWSEALQK